MTRSSWLIAGLCFMVYKVSHRALALSSALGHLLTRSQDDQVVAVHNFDALQPARLNLGGVEPGDPAGELGPIQVANPDHFAGGEFPFAASDSGRQQALAAFAQRLPG